MVVESVHAAEVRPLRGTVLRPDQPPEALVYPGDADAATLHAAVRDPQGRIIGVATISREAHPADPRPGDWRIRGMATDPPVRGQGAGAALLSRCLEHARANGGERVWCNARPATTGFYAREGFAVEGEAFELPGGGTRVRMTCATGR
jgi:GNAT superfamily N-acetyltransferase